MPPRRNIVFGLFAFFSCWALGQTASLGQNLDAIQTSLPGQIIRSLTVHPSDPDRILVGLKGRAPGSGVVMESRDAGGTWLTLNADAPVNPVASDVQAVAYGPAGVVLAGTWKQGLYRSSDDGVAFERLTGFPSQDIRDIKAVASDPSHLFAVTGGHGVFRSEDGGQSWQASGADGTFFWSVTTSPDSRQVYAASPTKIILASVDGGGNWQRIEVGAKAYAVAIKPGDPDALALATAAGLLLSNDGGATWSPASGAPAGNFSSLLFPAALPGILILGDWAAGVYLLDLESGKGRWLLEGVPVVHLAESNARLLVGTWGKGLLSMEMKPAGTAE